MGRARSAGHALLPVVGAACLAGLWLPVRAAAAQGEGATLSRSRASQVIQMQFEVQVRDATYGLVPGVQVTTGDAVRSMWRPWARGWNSVRSAFGPGVQL